MCDIPIIRIYAIQKTLDDRIEKKSWDDCASLANEIITLIPKALSKDMSKTGAPHLDGVYAIGIMRYEHAPQEIKKAITKMNRILRTAKRTIK